MEDRYVLRAANELVKLLNNTVDEHLPEHLAGIVKFHATGAAISALCYAWIPGVGATVAMFVAAGFIWTMYARINKGIGVPLSKNILKSVATAFCTNLAIGYAGSWVVGTLLSLFPVIGQIGAYCIMGGVCYAMIIAAGAIYLKVLTKIAQRKIDLATVSESELKQITNEVMATEDIKSLVNEARAEYKAARARGEIKQIGMSSASENEPKQITNEETE